MKHFLKQFDIVSAGFVAGLILLAADSGEYDGRVVSVESGCDFFSESLPAVISQVEKK